MTKDTLADFLLATQEVASKASALRVVNGVFDHIVDKLSEGEEVHINGFGSFRVLSTAARQGRNPKTGASITIAAGKKAKFKSSQALKQAIA